MNQDQIFLEREGDAWFQRNRATLNQTGKFDWPLALIDRLKDKAAIEKVLELGCSNGWRLHRLQESSARGRFVGVDASQQAIEDGQRNFPGLELYQGSLTDVPLQEQFDLVIVHFVLHWIDRQNLAKAVAEIDRLTRDGGLLLVGDFWPDYPQRRHYHHLPDETVYTYKQAYARIFEALGTYQEVARVSYSHDHPGEDLQFVPSEERAVCVVLHKSLNQYYPEIK